MRQRIMINPNMTRTKYRNSITISHSPPTKMCFRASHHSITSWYTIMNMKSMNDNISNILNRNARSIRDMHIRSSSINSLETVHNQLLFQLNNHVSLEHNPKWPILDNSVTQSSRPW